MTDTNLTSTSNANENDWCTIESDPAVFTELLETLDCTAVELKELYTLDDYDMDHTNNNKDEIIYGYIFLFPWKESKHNAERTATATMVSSDTPNIHIPEELFFAHQVTTNACATQALLSVVLNTVQDLGPTLSSFQSFTASFPPNLKGMAIAGSPVLQQAHNSFARADAFWYDSSQLRNQNRHASSKNDEEVYHFVAYIPYKGIVYELDGLQEHPIVVGTYSYHDNDNNNNSNNDTSDTSDTTTTTATTHWTQVARQALQNRIQNSPSGKFNLMAVIPNQVQKIQKQLQQLETNNDNTLLTVQLQQQLEYEQNKRKQWKLENQRRRHNYVPLCVQLLKEMAHQNILESYIQQAQVKQNKKRRT